MPIDGDIAGGAFASGSTYLTIPPTRAATTTNQHNVVLTAAEIAAGVVVFNPTSNHDLTGIVPPSPAQGYTLRVLNGGTANLHLRQNDSGSVAANRFVISDDHTLSPGEFSFLIYANGAWRISNKH